MRGSIPVFGLVLAGLLSLALSEAVWAQIPSPAQDTTQSVIAQPAQGLKRQSPKNSPSGSENPATDSGEGETDPADTETEETARTPVFADEDLYPPIPPEETETAESQTPRRANPIPDSRAPEGPFDPLGVQVGSFLIFPELGISLAYSDNVLAESVTPHADVSFLWDGKLAFRSLWRRHELAGESRLTKQAYRNLREESALTGEAKLSGRVDVSRRTQLLASGTLSRERTRLSYRSTERGDLVTVGGELEGRHRFNRLSFRLRGSLTHRDYGAAGDATGGDDGDYWESDLALRVSYTFSPRLTVFADGEGLARRYDRPVDGDGYRQGGKGKRAAVGMTLAFGAKLSGEFRVGGVFYAPEDPRLADIRGLILDADILWKPTALTSLNFRAASDVEESGESGVSGSLVQSFSFTLEHALFRHLMALAEVSVVARSVVGNGDWERIATATVGADMFFSREVLLSGRLSHSRSWAGGSLSPYRETSLTFGLRLRR